MKSFWKSILVILVTIFSLQVLSNETTSESQRVLKILNQQLNLLATIEPTVERIDFARISVLKRSIQNLIDNIEKNVQQGRQAATRKTYRLIDGLVIQYNYSQVFFGWEEEPSIYSIYTPMMENQLLELQTSYKKIIEIYEMEEESPYTTITSSSFKQIHKLVKTLEQLPLKKDIKKSLRKLWGFIGKTIAVASNGDRPCTFNMATRAVKKIRALYPDFNELSSSNAAFAPIMEVQGITEWYAEYAQIDRQEQTGTCN